MRTQSSDTHPNVEKKLIELIRQRSIKEKLEQVLSLSSFTMRLSKRAIARANPGKSKHELDLLFVKYHYGDDLANKVNRYLQNKDNDSK